MGKIMSKQERAEISRLYVTAISIENFKEARELDDILYESEFNRYLELTNKRREHISLGGGPCSYQLAIEEVLERLKSKLEDGLNLVSMENEGKQK